MPFDPFAWFFSLVPVPTMALVFGLMLYWTARRNGTGRTLPAEDLFALDDAMHAALLATLMGYTLIARRVGFFGVSTAVMLSAALLGVRAVRGRKLTGWPLALVVLVGAVVLWRLTHPLGPSPIPGCTRFIQNAG